MNRLIIIFLLVLLSTHSWADIKIVPTEFTTIQEAIESATNGDTVLVLVGRYTENINFLGKNIFLTSLIYLDGDTSFISNTIIDGNATGSVVVFESGEDSSAVLNGFTITNGVSLIGGGGILADFSSSPTLRNLYIHGNRAAWLTGGGISGGNGSNVKIENVVLWNNRAQTHGGGIQFRDSDPILMNVVVRNNISDGPGGGMLFLRSDPILKNVTVKNNRVIEGGGGGIGFSRSNPSFENVSVTGNFATTVGGGLNFWDSTPTFDPINRSNIYFNYAPEASDLHTNLFSAISIIVDTFSVMVPSSIHATPIDSFTFDILNAKFEQIESDLYVNPDGDDINSGLSAGEPLKTITFALSKIIADSLTPHTIFLSNGKYSPSSNGEHFPLFMQDYVSLSGDSKSGTILDAERQHTVINLNGDEGVTLVKMTITGGKTSRNGGGINSVNSDPILENIIISDNFALSLGGGIYIENSNPTFSGITVRYNQATRNGGGIYIKNSDVIFDSGIRSNIYLNRADGSAGSDLASQSINIDVVLDTFTVIEPYDSHASPRDRFNFDILNAKVESVISTDAVVLTLRSQEGIRLDSSLARIHQKALEGSYQLVDAMQYIHAFPRYQQRELTINSTDIIASAWVRGELLTGDPFIDSLGMKYDLIGVRHTPLGNIQSLANMVELSFREPLEMVKLTAEYEKHSEVIFAEPNYFGGDGDNIWTFMKNDSTYFVFSRGGGDCPAGCTERDFNYIAVDSVGNAIYYGEADGDSFPLIPIWNIPGVYQMSQFVTADSIYDVILNNPIWWNRRHAIEGMGLLFSRNYPPFSNEVDSIWYELKDDVINRKQETLFVLNQAKNDSDLDVLESAEAVLDIYQTLISVKDDLSTTPDVFNLHQNYPNPFNSETIIEYDLSIRSIVKLIIYNIRGEEVALLINGSMPAGNHRVSWDASRMASGIYMYRLQAGDFIQTRKMMLLK